MPTIEETYSPQKSYERDRETRARIAAALKVNDPQQLHPNGIAPTRLPVLGQTLEPVEVGGAYSGQVQKLSPAMQWLISKESSGSVTADNPKSTAYGLGQLLESNRRAYGQRLGFNPDTTDYYEQLAMMESYIKDRYGTPEKAVEFHKSKGYY